MQAFLPLLQVAIALAALFASLYLAWMCALRPKGFEPFRDSPGTPADAEVDWQPLPLPDSARTEGDADRVGADSDADEARPLLDLALQRIAARRGPEWRSAPRRTRVVAAWRERLPLPLAAPSSPRSDKPDRWYRWKVDACFFRVDDAFATCEPGLDVRARAEWASSKPPTEWNISFRDGGKPPPEKK